MTKMMPGRDHHELDQGLNHGAAIPFIFNYQVQSYLSTALGANAIVLPRPPPNEASSPVNSQITSKPQGGPSLNGINPNTQVSRDIEGVGFALSPASEAPIKVLPTFKHAAGHSAAVLLKPGQVYYPGKSFKSFKVGLPYGWLGGGTVHLIVLREFLGYSFWTGDREVLFHRVTLPVQAANADPTGFIAPNWPNRYPWTNAVAIDPAGGVLRYPLPGTPEFSVQPTRVVSRLLLPVVTGAIAPFAGGTTRFDFLNSDEFDTGSPSAGNFATSLDVAWNSITQSGFQVNAGLVFEAPMQTLTADQLRIGGDTCSLQIVTPDGSVPAGSYIDFVRYGTL